MTTTDPAVDIWREVMSNRPTAASDNDPLPEREECK